MIKMKIHPLMKLTTLDPHLPRYPRMTQKAGYLEVLRSITLSNFLLLKPGDSLKENAGSAKREGFEKTQDIIALLAGESALRIITQKKHL